MGGEHRVEPDDGQDHRRDDRERDGRRARGRVGDHRGPDEQAGGADADRRGSADRGRITDAHISTGTYKTQNGPCTPPETATSPVIEAITTTISDSRYVAAQAGARRRCGRAGRRRPSGRRAGGDAGRRSTSTNGARRSASARPLSYCRSADTPPPIAQGHAPQVTSAVARISRWETSTSPSFGTTGRATEASRGAPRSADRPAADAGSWWRRSSTAAASSTAIGPVGSVTCPSEQRPRCGRKGRRRWLQALAEALQDALDTLGRAGRP